MLSICWWWSWSGEALLFLFNLVFIELISNICANWCWVFVGHDLGQVQPLIFREQDLSWIDVKYLCQLMLSICWWWSWSGEALLFLFNLVFLEFISIICANWCRVFVGRGLGQVQAALVLLPPTSLPRPARRRPPPHLLRHQFFSQSFFLQIFTFSPASSITQKTSAVLLLLLSENVLYVPRFIMFRSSVPFLMSLS